MESESESVVVLLIGDFGGESPHNWRCDVDKGFMGFCSGCLSMIYFSSVFLWHGFIAGRGTCTCSTESDGTLDEVVGYV